MGSNDHEAQDYVNEMAQARGYVLDYHKVMAKQDFDVLKSANGLVSSVYLDERSIDRKTKELLFILSLTVLRAPQAQIISHIRVALDLGVKAHEILESIEIALPEAGVVVFQHGFEAWKSVVEPASVEPTVRTHDVANGGDA